MGLDGQNRGQRHVKNHVCRRVSITIKLIFGRVRATGLALFIARNRRYLRMGEPPVLPDNRSDSSDSLPSFRQIIRRSYLEFVAEFKAALLSRKYWIFIGTTSVASYHLWNKKLPEDEYTQLIIWLFVLFFAGNFAQKVVDKDKKPRKMAVRLKSSKFLSTAIMLTFFNFALHSQILSAVAYTTLTIWLVGMFFGVDVASIYAFRNQVGNGQVLDKIFDQTKNRKRVYERHEEHEEIREVEVPKDGGTPPTAPDDQKPSTNS